MSIKIAGAQLNTTIGDFSGNLQKMQIAAKEAQEKYAADLIVFPELVVCGYPAEDLLYRDDFLQACQQTILDYAASTPDICSIVGAPWIEHGVLKNAAVVTRFGKIQQIYFKQTLPNYGVFDEKRYFLHGVLPSVIEINHINIGLAICEDLWVPEIAAQLKKLNVDMIVSLNASPFEIDKHEQRVEVLRERIHETKLPIFYVNAVGGQDDLIFDGDSMALDANGNSIMQLPCFEEAMGIVEFNNLLKNFDLIHPHPPVGTLTRAIHGSRPSTTSHQNRLSCRFASRQREKGLSRYDNVYKALKLGLHDYVKKTSFKRVLVGSSGGIDSAVTLAIAVDALGAENVISVMMPSQFTAQMSLDDAAQLAKNLQIEHHVLPITNCFNAFTTTLTPAFKNTSPDKTEENLQARCRGTLLMALSNKWNALVLNTSNRSEVAVGYSTLYGDLIGAYAVLKDVYKTQVYDLANMINHDQEIIPHNIITRAPSAELRDNQKDEDSLPPYSTLDRILSMTLDQEKSIAEIINAGFSEVLVRDIIRLLHLNEYKRQQAPLGPRIHQRAFGRRARRYPIVHGYKG